MLNVQHLKKASMAVLGIMLLAVAISCRDDDAGNLTAITMEDATEAITSSVTSQTNGLAKTMTDASAFATTQAIYTTDSNLECNKEYTGVYNASSSQAAYSYNYSGTRAYTLQCQNNLSSAFLYNAALQGTYDTPRMYSDDNSHSTLTVTGLAPAETAAVFNGSYVRNGHQESKVLQRRNFNSVLTYTLNAVTVNKVTQKIQGGTTSVTFAGTGSGGNTYNYNGSITFNGDDTATLILNGTTYTINL